MYKEPLHVLKTRTEALKKANREPLRYMERSELCDDIWCGLCYKGRNEKAPWNLKAEGI